GLRTAPRLALSQCGTVYDGGLCDVEHGKATYVDGVDPVREEMQRARAMPTLACTAHIASVVCSLKQFRDCWLSRWMWCHHQWLFLATTSPCSAACTQPTARAAATPPPSSSYRLQP
ncbi:hypothetical protein HaLaN_32332, partial [Haematococcus lacustris]